MLSLEAVPCEILRRTLNLLVRPGKAPMTVEASPHRSALDRPPEQLTFQVFGGVEVHVGSGLIDAGHSRQRCVLAALVVDANRAVSIDRIIARVWADRAPSRSRETIYSYISRLRRILMRFPDVQIAHRSSGYVLSVDPLAVDLHRFRRLANQARRESDGGEKVALLDQALQLWRGPALAGLSTQWANGLREALTNERVAVELDRNDIALRRGLHSEILASMLDSSVRRPLDERLAAQLILGLYRCGQQSEALDRYERVRRQLADELGVDPNPSLQALYQQILTHRVGSTPLTQAWGGGVPVGVPPEAASTGEPAIRVSNIPPANPHFRGRHDVLEQLRYRLASESALAVQTLYGLGGVGKTQLVLEYAHRHATSYDLIWWVDAEQPILIPDQFGELATRMGLQRGASPSDTVNRVLRELAGRRGWLLIFDNAAHPSDIAPFRPPGAGHCLVTSRYPAWGAVGGRIEIDVLDRSAAVSFVRARVPDMSSDDAAELAAELGDLPLALAQAVAYLEQTGLDAQDYIDRLRAHGSGDLLGRGDLVDYGHRVGTTWAVSVERLRAESPAGAALLEVAAFLGPETIPLTLFTERPHQLDEPLQSIGEHRGGLTDAVGSLVRYSLVRRNRDGFDVHRMVQAAIRNKLQEGEHDRLTNLVLKLLSAAIETADLYDPTSWPTYARLTPHILAACPRNDHHPTSRRLLLDAAEYFYVRGDAPASRFISNGLLDRWRNTLGADHPDTLTAAAHLTSAMVWLVQSDETHLLGRDTLTRARLVLGPDHPVTLRTALNLTFALNWLGKLSAAAELGEDTWRRCRRVLGPDSPDTLRIAANLAQALSWQGHTEQARAVGEDALRRARSVLGPDHPTTLVICLVVASYQLLAWHGEFTDPTLLEQTLQTARSVLGDDHHTTLGLAAVLAAVATLHGNSKAGHLLSTDTRERSEKSLGADHLITLVSTAVLALTHHPHDDHPQAQALADTLLRHQNRFGFDHAISPLMATALTAALMTAGRKDEAVRVGLETLHRCAERLNTRSPFKKLLTETLCTDSPRFDASRFG